MKFSLRLLYLYLFSFVGLLVTVIGSIQLLDLGIRSVVFPDADVYNYTFGQTQAREDARRNRQRELSDSLAMIVVALPLYLYHWKLIKKEK